MRAGRHSLLAAAPLLLGTVLFLACGEIEPPSGPSANPSGGSSVGLTGTPAGAASPSFTDLPAVEPNPAYPLPAGCQTELAVGLLHRLFAAINRGDVAGARALFDDSFWFDLGRDPASLLNDPSATGVVSAIDEASLARLLARFRGMHLAFATLQPGTMGPEKDPQGREIVGLGEVRFRVTGQAITSAGFLWLEGGGKGGADCATKRFATLVIGVDRGQK